MITFLAAVWFLAPPKPHCDVREEVPHTNTDVDLPPIIGYEGKRKFDRHIEIPVNRAHIGCM